MKQPEKPDLGMMVLVMSLRLLVVFLFVAGLVSAQVIEFESGGLKYQTLSKNGITIMFSFLPVEMRDYSVLQVAASNGAASSFTVRPEDFYYHRKDGTVVRAATADSVVGRLLKKAGRNDVIKLTSTYEMGLYGLVRFRSTNGYEQRRRSALAEVSSSKLKAAAAASAIAFVETRLRPGDSTDGAVFFPRSGRSFGRGMLRVTAAGQTFEFEFDPPPLHARRGQLGE
ncbi:MAG: hypothetical protein ABFD60_15710 [Bryobacteraceae bacterium]